MSVVIPGSIGPSWIFAWAAQIPLHVSDVRSNPFSFKGHEVHLKFIRISPYYQVELCTPLSFPSLSKADIIVRVETKSKTPLDLPNNCDARPNLKIVWQYKEGEIEKKYPGFLNDGRGRILRFLVYDVDPIKDFQKAEKFVQTFEHFNDVSSLKGLSLDLSVLLENQGDSPDLELLCLCGAKRSIKVHKDIVSARSKVFSAMLKSGMSEDRTCRIEIKDIECQVFDHFVGYLYTGKLPQLNVDIARSLYEAGDKYEVANLMRQSASFLEENLKLHNACEMLLLADAHNDQEFRERVINFIMEYEIPFQDAHWLPFHVNYPKLSSEVLYRFCKQQRKK